MSLKQNKKNRKNWRRLKKLKRNKKNMKNFYYGKKRDSVKKKKNKNMSLNGRKRTNGTHVRQLNKKNDK